MFVNVGPLERKLRIVIGFALIAMGFTAPLPEQWHLAAMSLSIIALFPALFGFCPLKALLLRRLGNPS
jgi:hypothetical protein